MQFVMNNKKQLFKRLISHIISTQGNALFYIINIRVRVLTDQFVVFDNSILKGYKLIDNKNLSGVLSPLLPFFVCGLSCFA